MIENVLNENRSARGDQPQRHKVEVTSAYDGLEIVLE